MIRFIAASIVELAILAAAVLLLYFGIKAVVKVVEKINKEV